MPASEPEISRTPKAVIRGRIDIRISMKTSSVTAAPSAC